MPPIDSDLHEIHPTLAARREAPPRAPKSPGSSQAGRPPGILGERLPGPRLRASGYPPRPRADGRHPCGDVPRPHSAGLRSRSSARPASRGRSTGPSRRRCACDGVWSAEDHAAIHPGRLAEVHRLPSEARGGDDPRRRLYGPRRRELRHTARYGQRALDADAVMWGPSEHQLRELDDRRLEQQVSAPGLTCLDRLMTTAERPPMRAPSAAPSGRPCRPGCNACG